MITLALGWGDRVRYVLRTYCLCTIGRGLTLSRLGTSLVRHLALPVHISSDGSLTVLVGAISVYLLVGQIVGPVCGPYEPHT